MLLHHYTVSLPVKASWYDQKQVCSCQISMRNVPIRGSMQGYQEHAKLESDIISIVMNMQSLFENCCAVMFDIAALPGALLWLCH